MQALLLVRYSVAIDSCPPCLLTFYRMCFYAARDVPQFTLQY